MKVELHAFIGALPNTLGSEPVHTLNVGPLISSYYLYFDESFFLTHNCIVSFSDELRPESRWTRKRRLLQI